MGMLDLILHQVSNIKRQGINGSVHSINSKDILTAAVLAIGKG